MSKSTRQGKEGPLWGSSCACEGLRVLAATDKGRHHISVHPHVRELVNLQEVDDKAKSYEVRQWFGIVER